MSNHQVLKELKTTIDAWILETEECDFVDNDAGCPLRKLLVAKRKTLTKTLGEDENTKTN